EKWSLDLTDSQGAPTHATDVAWARGGALVVLGTPSGIETFVPGDLRPTSDAMHLFDTSSAVNRVAVSATGTSVAAATNGYTFFAPVDPATNKVVVPAYSFNNQGNVQALAMTQDGERFASASGSRIYFFHASHDSHIAIPDGSYDGTGRLLVAAAGGNVLGFSPGVAAPVWTLDAVAAGLDAPLVRARVSDGW